MTINFNGAVEAVREALYASHAVIDSEASAVEEAREALEEYVDLSDGYDDIMGAITAPVYWQMMEEMDDAIFDGVDAWIASELTRLGLADEFEGEDRDEQIAAIYDAL